MIDSFDANKLAHLLALLSTVESGEIEVLKPSESNQLFLDEIDSPATSKLIKAIYDSGLILGNFNWCDWREEARRYSEDVSLIKTADLITLRKLLTISIRQDRFVSGLFNSLCSSGFVRAIFTRLQVIYASTK